MGCRSRDLGNAPKRAERGRTPCSFLGNFGAVFQWVEVISQHATGTMYPPALPLPGLCGVNRALPQLLWSFSRNSAGLELSQPFPRLWVGWEGCSVRIASACMAGSSGGSWGQMGCPSLCSQATEP